MGLINKIVHSGFGSAFIIIMAVAAAILIAISNACGDDGSEGMQVLFLLLGIACGIICFFSIVAAVLGSPT